jgi:sulfide:quinone oxidoreductase
LTKKIAVVGSGTGGTLTANLLTRRLKDRIRHGAVEVHVFGERNDHIFQPGFLDIAFRGSNPSNVSRPESDLLRNEVKYNSTSVERIDLKDRKIHSGNVDFQYDYIVIATGASTNTQLVPGLSESSFNFHSTADNAAALWKELQTFKGGRIVILIATPVYKCPPSPNEAAFLLDDYLRSRGIRDASSITFLTPFPRAYPAVNVSQIVEPLFKKRGIEVLPFFNVDYVDPHKKNVHSLEGDSIEFDLLISVPPHQGTKAIRNSEIGDVDGWIPCDKRRLTITGFDDAFAVGDATNIPVSKTGVVAHLHANVAADSIVSEIDGVDGKREYDGRIHCPFETGEGKATFVIANYESPPPSLLPKRSNLLMKKAFSRMYWSALSGGWESLFNFYFNFSGPKKKPVSRVTSPLSAPIKMS